MDWPPLLLLMACTGLFVGYHPYTRAYQTYFQAQAPVMNAEAMESLVYAAAVPHYLPEGMEVGLYAPGVAYAGWTAATVVLTMVAGILMLRGWRRRMV